MLCTHADNTPALPVATAPDNTDARTKNRRITIEDLVVQKPRAEK